MNKLYKEVNVNGFVKRNRMRAVATLLFTLSQAALSESIKVDLDIASQAAVDALVELADKTGLEIIVSESLSKDTISPAVNGRVSVEQALNILLADTGLVYQYTSDNMVVIQAAGNEENKNPESKRSGDMVRDRAIDEVVVTGSKIARTGYDTPTPVTLIDRGDIVASGLNNLSDLLMQSPAIGVGLGAANSNFSPEAGASFINLRGLGTDRSLVLINGRRRVPGSRASAAVDLSTIPASLVERVEVITGGASAVYGADAVSGVVNVILRKDIDGMEVNVRSGMSQHGGADTTSFSILGGTSFNEDNGHISMALSYDTQEALMATDRGFSSVPWRLYPVTNDTGPNDGIPARAPVRDYRFVNTHPAGTFCTSDGRRYTIDPNLRSTSNGTEYFGSCGFLGGGGGDGFNRALYDQLRNPLDTLSFVSNFEYEFLNNITAFVDLEYARTEAKDFAQPTFDFGLPILRENPFIPADLASFMDAEGLSQISLNRTNVDHGNSINNLERSTYTIAAGFNGEVGEWTWDAYYQLGRYSYEGRHENDRIQSRFFQAIDVIDDGSGNPVCRDSSGGCVPLNVLGQNAASPEALGWIHHTLLDFMDTEQNLASIQLTGDLFTLPAGQVKLAAGVEYRKESLRIRSDGLAAIGESWYGVPNDPVDKDFSVKEFYAETLVPVLRDMPLVKELNIEAAVRRSDYNTVGNTTAWKFQGEWSPVDSLRLRASRSNSVRAPNLIELFNPGSVGFDNIFDPCDVTRINLNPRRASNCAALGLPAGWEDPASGFTQSIVFGGNPDLTPEESDSLTVGAVFRADLWRGDFSTSLDFWKIKIEDAINSTSLYQIVNGCVDAESILNPFCSLITRGSDGAITEVSNKEVNIASLEASGIDLALNYTFEVQQDFLPGGIISMGANITYLDKFEELADATDLSSLIIRDTEVGYPEWRWNFDAAYSVEDVSVIWRTRYIGEAVLDAQIALEDLPDGVNNVDAAWYHDARITYDFSENYNVEFGVNNLFDEEPPKTPQFEFCCAVYQGSGTTAALYDNIGRFFYLGLSAKF